MTSVQPAHHIDSQKLSTQLDASYLGVFIRLEPLEHR